MRSLLGILLCTLSVCGASVGFAPEASARELAMETLAVELTIGADGVLHVVERLHVRFTGSWNGIIRSIPYADARFAGFRRSIALRVDAVEDAQGGELKHWKTRENGRVYLKIKVPDARDAVREVVIRYRALNVVLGYSESESDFGGHDELYWNVVGPEWEFPIESATCTLTLPDSITKLDPATVHARSFRGYRRSPDAGPDLTRQPDGRYVLEEHSALRRGEALTIVVAFPSGHVAHPGFFTRALWFIQVNWFLGIPLLALLAWLGLWWFYGRDSLGRRTIIPEFAPPEGLGAAEVGVLLDERLDERDVTAGIIDLAVRGYIRIRAGKKSRQLELDREKLRASPVPAFDQRLITGLFGSTKSTLRVSSLKYKFVPQLAQLRALAARSLVSHGFWTRKPKLTKNFWTGLTIAALVPIAGIGFAFAKSYFLVLVPCALGMFMIARAMSKRTPKGLDALARVMGMQEYMQTAERDRMAKLPMETFEKLMPYAVAFGLHDRWLAAFSSIFKQNPEWLASDSGFKTGTLRSAIRGLNRDVGSSLYSGPRPPAPSTGGSSSSGWGGGWSGGSGFSGGGSSGGGFGGGGGGGW